jgi:hypothetical protein
MPPNSNTTVKYSYAQPVWKLVLLSLLTLNLYHFYWFYRNWKHIKSHTGADIRPGLRTIGLLVPILNFFLVYDQFEDIHALSTPKGMAAMYRRYSPLGLMLIYVLINSLRAPLFPDPWSWLALLGFIPLIFVQQALNDYWQREQPDHPVRRRLSGPEMGVLALGGVWVVLVVVGILVPADYAAARGYQHACEDGDATACNNLGAIYYNGEGVTQDLTRAASLFQEACDGGEAMGCFSLGIMHTNGEGVTLDHALSASLFDRAASLFQEACDGGEAMDCYNLGLMYRDGLGVTGDLTRASLLLQKACEGGIAEACS